MPTGPVVLLGPQRAAPSLPAACAEVGLSDHDSLALVSAGWEEREAEDETLREALTQPLHNLELHARAERVFREDAPLFDALRARHDRMRRLRTVYRRRLDHSMAAWRDVLRLQDRGGAPGEGAEDEFTALERLDLGELPLMKEVLEDATQAVRDLDAGHLARVAALQLEFEQELRLPERPALAAQRQQVAALLGDCAGLLIAGGHVAVLLNRLRLFGLAEMMLALPVLGWSAGAMVLTERIVLFHDSPPQGQGAAEVFEPGLARAPGVVALPDAATRLLLDDPLRVATLARRMQPATCVLLDEGERITCDDHACRPARRLSSDGKVLAA
ncbi:MAG: hypothetical protein DRQ55_06600 [Planctomycetota bacterium]|nr:MAG: hypothetical protein DRQ55_06600 [Planctomycetota bacterium]